MNDIRITATLSLDEDSPDDVYVDFNLSIDGQYLHDVNVYIDPVALVTSCTMPGELFIYTCECGDPSCQGITEGVHVSHTDDTVKWRLRNPIAWPPEDPMPDWSHEGVFVFDKKHYTQQITTALDHAKRLVLAHTVTGKLWVGPNLTKEALLTLEVPQESHYFAVAPDRAAFH